MYVLSNSEHHFVCPIPMWREFEKIRIFNVFYTSFWYHFVRNSKGNEVTRAGWSQFFKLDFWFQNSLEKRCVWAPECWVSVWTIMITIDTFGKYLEDLPKRLPGAGVWNNTSSVWTQLKRQLLDKNSDSQTALDVHWVFKPSLTKPEFDSCKIF